MLCALEFSVPCRIHLPDGAQFGRAPGGVAAAWRSEAANPRASGGAVSQGGAATSRSGLSITNT